MGKSSAIDFLDVPFKQKLEVARSSFEVIEVRV